MSDDPPVRLKLFVLGDSLRSKEAVRTVRDLCEGQPRGRCRLKVVDLLQDPDEAEYHNVIAAPTLVREDRPLRVVGDLSDLPAVLSALELDFEPPG